MTSPKPSMRLSAPLVGSGFSAAPSRSAKTERKSFLSRVEGAAQRQFRLKARQKTVFELPPVQAVLPGFESGYVCNTRTLYPMGENQC